MYYKTYLNYYCNYYKMTNLFLQLNNGISIPAVGLGTYKSKGKELEEAVIVALENGIRHIDTAIGYKVNVENA